MNKRMLVRCGASICWRFATSQAWTVAVDHLAWWRHKVGRLHATLSMRTVQKLPRWLEVFHSCSGGDVVDDSAPHPSEPVLCRGNCENRAGSVLPAVLIDDPLGLGWLKKEARMPSGCWQTFRGLIGVGAAGGANLDKERAAKTFRTSPYGDVFSSYVSII